MLVKIISREIKATSGFEVPSGQLFNEGLGKLEYDIAQFVARKSIEVQLITYAMNAVIASAIILYEEAL